MFNMKYLIIYLIVINIVTFIVYGVDKAAAKAHKRRIRISTLLLLAAIGGSLGALLGMMIFRHKTKKWYFVFPVPFMLLVQSVLVVFVYYFFLR